MHLPDFLQAPAATARRVPVHTRWLIRRDMPEVLAIEAASFEFPWSEDEFLANLRQPDRIGMVAELPGTEIAQDAVVGHFVYEMHRRHLQIINLAVHPAWRRRGVGSTMLAKLRGKLARDRRTALYCRVRETNLAAQHFLAANAFQAVSVERGDFADTGEDSFVFRYSIV